MDQFFFSPIENFSRGSNFSELVLHRRTYKTINKFSPNFTFQIPYWGEANLKLNLHFKSIEKHTDKLKLSWLKKLHRKLWKRTIGSGFNGQLPSPWFSE